MEKTYNLIAGRSVGRLAALSDGVFAFAMTVIVLDLRVPPLAPIHSESDLARAVIALAPEAATYLMSFLTLGIFWVGQEAQLEQFERADRDLTWIQLAFLAAVATLPFSTRLLSDFIGFRVALLIYWANIVVLGSLLYASWAYAERARLVAGEAPPDLARAVRRRIVVAQALYALSAALCVIDTYVSIASIFTLQLYYAVAPRWRPRANGS